MDGPQLQDLWRAGTCLRCQRVPAVVPSPGKRDQYCYDCAAVVARNNLSAIGRRLADAKQAKRADRHARGQNLDG